MLWSLAPLVSYAISQPQEKKEETPAMTEDMVLIRVNTEGIGYVEMAEAGQEIEWDEEDMEVFKELIKDGKVIRKQVDDPEMEVLDGPIPERMQAVYEDAALSGKREGEEQGGGTAYGELEAGTCHVERIGAGVRMHNGIKSTRKIGQQCHQRTDIEKNGKRLADMYGEAFMVTEDEKVMRI